MKIQLNHFIEVTDQMLGELQQILQEIAQRLEQVEGQVQEGAGRLEALEAGGQQMAQYLMQLDAGIKGAAQQFDDDKAFGEFDAKYGELLAPYQDRLAALNPAGYDVKRDMFNLARDQGDNMDAFVNEKIELVKQALVKAAEGLMEVQETVEGLSEEPAAPEEPPAPTEVDGTTISPEVEALIGQM